MSGQLPCSSPADKVSSNDDLLTEILLRLPVRSLLRFTSVSKHWYFVISTPSFKLIRSRNPDPPSGLFFHSPDNTLVTATECDFIPFENPVKPPFKTLNFDPDGGRILIENSCNGLMLCSSVSIINSCINNPTCITKYYIYNPTINQFATLPKLGGNNNIGLTLAFDPSKSPYYKVIFVCGLNGNSETNYQIEVYSSETRTCKSSCKFLLNVFPSINDSVGVYWNNAIHWLYETGFVLYFNLDQEIVHQIKTPFALLGLDYRHYFSYIFESRDHLLLVETNKFLTSKFKIHELKRDYSGWFVKYHVDLDEVGGTFPEIINSCSGLIVECSILSLVLGEKEDDSFLVLEIRGNAVRLNLISKTFHKLCDFPLSLSQRLRCELMTLWPYVYQFVESLYSV